MDNQQTLTEQQTETKKETLEKTATANNKQILNLEIERNGSIKIKIKVASEIEQFFRENGTIKTAINGLGTNKAIKYYNLENSNRELTACFNVNDINEKLIYSGYINSAILRMVGISEGVELSVNQLISKDALTESAKMFREGLISFYKRYINPIHISTALTINEL